MNIEIKTLLSQNITLVYDSLDLKAVDSSRLKQLTSIGTSPLLMDTPEIIVAAYPPDPVPVFIQLGDRRIRITISQDQEEIGNIALWEIATECSELVPKSSSSLIAYGFNYDVLVELSKGNAGEFLARRFIRDLEMVQTSLQGHLIAFIPRFRFRRGQSVQDLALEPVDQQHIKAHLNSHFGFDDIALPSSEELRESFFREYEYLRSMLSRLFEGGE